MGINWAAIGNYTVAIVLTAAIVISVMHVATKGRIWKTFDTDKYKCGMVQILSADQTPDLTGLYPTPTDASSAVLNCNAPQAFLFDHQLCTLHDGKYTCYPQPRGGMNV